MNIVWTDYPLATHYHQTTDCYYFIEDGVWQIVFIDGDYGPSKSLYNGDVDPEDLIAKGDVTDRVYLIQQIHANFTKIGELLDYLDVKLPEHEAAQTKAKEIV